MGDSQPQPPSRKNEPTASSNPMMLQRRIEQLEAELRETKELMAGFVGLEHRMAIDVRQDIAGPDVETSSAATPIPTPSTSSATPTLSPKSRHSPGADCAPPAAEGFDPSLHLLLILSDSALPLGSFAFSSGLESYLTHQQHASSHPKQPPIPLLRRFLSLSLSSLATTTLPFIRAASNIPQSPIHTTTHTAISSILNLSDSFDATITCPVLRRASISQGKALLSVWEKSLRQPPQSPTTPSPSPSAIDLPELIIAYRHQGGNNNPPHLPIAWALISLYSNFTLHQTTFVFLLNHSKALLSAAVRLNLIGPYVAQKILAAPETLEIVRRAQEVGVKLGVEEVGQTVPTLDLYQGRHELLYSRVFNS